MGAAGGLLDSLELEEVGEGRFRAAATGAGQAPVFGGQLLAQSIVAANKVNTGKDIKTIHSVFARAASTEYPVDYEVEVLHAGRAFASASVTARQGDRLCTRSTVLSSASEPDLIRHAAPMPAVPSPDDLPATTGHVVGWDIRIVGEVDLSDPAAVGPAELDIWSRFDVEGNDLLASQELLAYASDGFLIGTAMRPHAGVGHALAHVTISTGVITHTLTFHEPFNAAEWLLMHHSAPFAGAGRTYGRADVYTEDGNLVASFVQDAMIRHMPEGHSR